MTTPHYHNEDEEEIPEKKEGRFLKWIPSILSILMFTLSLVVFAFSRSDKTSETQQKDKDVNNAAHYAIIIEQSSMKKDIDYIKENISDLKKSTGQTNELLTEFLTKKGGF